MGWGVGILTKSIPGFFGFGGLSELKGKHYNVLSHAAGRSPGFT